MLYINFRSPLYTGGGFCDIDTLGDMGTEINFFVQNMKNALGFEMTSSVEHFSNFISVFTIVSNEVNHHNAWN
jgi:hypothetical protein